jgi:hypothetical protein
MATLAVLTPNLGDQDLSPVAVAAGGDQFLNDGRTILYFKNTNASDRTITIVTSGTVGGLAIADVTLVISQNEEKAIGPFEPRYFNDANGYVQLTYSADAGLTVRPIRVT